MSNWGKIIGGVAGLALGGPIGAILGVYAGHVVDKSQGGAPGGYGGASMEARQVAFTTAVIVLGAKMAKADGVVTRDEVDAFKQAFHIPAHEMSAVGSLWEEARKESAGAEPYARQVAQMFAHERAVLEELLGGLFHIAKADGSVHPAELEFLATISGVFGFSAREFERIRATHLGAGEREGEGDPYAVLGLTRSASDEEIKKTYRKMSREYHPDNLIAQGMPQEFVDLANEKMASINHAHDRIEKERKLK